MTTIKNLAAEFDIQPYEVAAALDLGREYLDDTEIDQVKGWTEAEAREVLTILATQAAERV